MEIIQLVKYGINYETGYNPNVYMTLPKVPRKAPEKRPNKVPLPVPGQPEPGPAPRRVPAVPKKEPVPVGHTPEYLEEENLICSSFDNKTLEARL